MSQKISGIEANAVSHIENASTTDEKRELGRNIDDALRFTLDHEQSAWTPEEERRVVRKIDFIILPMIFFVALWSYADTQIYGFAALFGLIEDLELFTIKIVGGKIVPDTSKYSFTAGIVYLGAVAAQYPLLLVAQHVSVGKFLGAMQAYAGMCTLLFIVCRNFADVMALRFFYGWQSVIQSVAPIVTAMWWKTDEQPLRVGCWVSGAALGSLVGQGIDLGAISLRGTYAEHAWKWIYVIFGSISIGYSLVVLLLFPANPIKAWFFNEREKYIAVQRLVKNHTGIQTRKFKLKHVLEAVMDPQLFVFAVFTFSFSFANSSIGSFAGFLVTSFGYTKRDSLLLNMPVVGVAFASIILSGIIGGLLPRRRILISVAFLLPTIAGNAILWKSPRHNKGALLAGLYMVQIFYGALVQVYGMLSSNIAGHTKKSTINAIVAIFGALGGFSGPWAYKGQEAEDGYPTGQSSTLSLMAICVVANLLLWFHYTTQNKKKAIFLQERPELANDPNYAFNDMTDRENPVFQYAL